MSYINPGDSLRVTSPADLKQAADDLREQARRLSLVLPSFGGVLHPVDMLDNSNTWAGPFADNFGVTRTGWNHGLYNAVSSLRDMRRSLEADAAELDARAAKAGAGGGGR